MERLQWQWKEILKDWRRGGGGEEVKIAKPTEISRREVFIAVGGLKHNELLCLPAEIDFCSA